MKKILEIISRHMNKKKIIRNSQHGFITGKSCLTDSTNFYEITNVWLDDGRAVDTLL